jgi:hypothetical protein
VSLFECKRLSAWADFFLEFTLQVLVLQGLHGRGYMVAMYVSIRNERTFPRRF